MSKPPLCFSSYISNSDLISSYCAHPLWKFRFSYIFLSKTFQLNEAWHQKGTVYEVLIKYIYPVSLGNYTFPNDTTVDTVIKELLFSRGQDWSHTTLYTYDSFSTNKN